MPTIAAGSSPVINLLAGQRLVFAAGGAGTAIVQRVGSNPVPMLVGATPVNIGPFRADHPISIACERALSYDVQMPPLSRYGDGGALGSVSDTSGAEVGPVATRSLTPLFDIFDQQVSTPRRALSIPTPYASVGPDLAHPSVIYVPEGWCGWRFWMAYTPYPTANSDYENPCIACSQDGENWFVPNGATNPLVQRPTPGYNADTHIVLSPDNTVMYMIYREKVSGVNNVRILESRDGRRWSAPRTVLSGLVASLQDYASPSVMWDAANSRWVMISHNLDAGASYPMQRNVTSGPDIYGPWSAPAAISINNPTGGRTFWHSGFERLVDGRIVGLLQDIVNGGAGAPGALFAGESLDGGLTFSVRLVYGDLGFYRCHLSLIDGAQGFAGCHAWIGRQVSTFSIQREDWAPGADQRNIDAAYQQFAAFGLWPATVLWFDNFNRADGALGTPLVGTALVVDSGAYTIVSNRASSSTGSAGNNRALGTLTVGDYVVEVTNTAAGSAWWLIFRAVDTANYWRLGGTVAGSTNLRIQNIVGGSINSDNIVQGPLNNNAITQGDRVRVVCRGRRFRIYVNGRYWAEITDNSGRFTNNVSTGVKFGFQADGTAASFDNLLVMA